MQLLNFWAIVVVIILSFFFLKVRYNLFQILGILVCVGGMGVLFGSDAITNANNFPAADRVKGNLFALLGATCYGVANTAQEYLVSEAPMYEVLSMMGVWGTCINGVQAAIFDRVSFRKMQQVYRPKIGGYIAGFDLLLFLFYSLAPIILRMGSAAFLNISLLTSNFWGTIVGIHVFHLTIHWMYPIAFVLIICGLVVYFTMEGRWGDSFKPWLGENQERGFAGIGTAKKRIENPEAVV
jgi:solute carrier family 35 protein F1/2